RCDCWSHNRECDPFLCGKCGVLEVLDSYNKYDDDMRKGRCKNNRIQLGLPAPTTKAPSQVQGYGLYSRAEIMAGDFIGEYTGEIISINEGDRRGAMYHVLKQEYLFTIKQRARNRCLEPWQQDAVYEQLAAGRIHQCRTQEAMVQWSGATGTFR
ncbi:hypothetical protein LTR40_012694, partial [Exophiala xenobiotica]